MKFIIIHYIFAQDYLYIWYTKDTHQIFYYITQYSSIYFFFNYLFIFPLTYQNISVHMKNIKIRKKSDASEVNSHTYAIHQPLQNHISPQTLKNQLIKILKHQIPSQTNTNYTDLIDQINNWEQKLESEKYQLSPRNTTDASDIIEATFHKFQQLLSILIYAITHQSKEKERQYEKLKEQNDLCITVKSQQRKKLRILKPNDIVSQIKNTALEKQEQNYDKIIFDLREKNKGLERRMILLGQEFRVIKHRYEKQILKYKYLLNNSLLNLREQVDEVNGGKLSSGKIPSAYPGYYDERSMKPRIKTEQNMESRRYLDGKNFQIQSQMQSSGYPSPKNRQIRKYLSEHQFKPNS